jgi:hypothetical protein
MSGLLAQSAQSADLKLDELRDKRIQQCRITFHEQLVQLAQVLHLQGSSNRNIAESSSSTTTQIMQGNCCKLQAPTTPLLPFAAPWWQAWRCSRPPRPAHSPYLSPAAHYCHGWELVLMIQF